MDAHYHYPKEQGRAFYENFTNVAADLDKCYSTDLITARARNGSPTTAAPIPTSRFSSISASPLRTPSSMFRPAPIRPAAG
jgi:hypothetical protein